jgi:formiminotetrahydrofolate cyclodeaminase
MRYSELSCIEFTEMLASRAPVPGGGGVSALVGALSAALCSMVGNLTVGKKKYADVEEEIRACMEQTDQMRVDLLALIEADAEAFEPLSKAYGLPKETEEEKRKKEQTLEVCLKRAADAPYQIMKKVCELIPLIEVFAEKGSVIALSDAGVAAALSSAALKSADLNVRINTRLMKDRAYADQLNRECNRILSEEIPLADRILKSVTKRLS